LLEPVPGGTSITVIDEAHNPPARTGHYRGEGWPEILDLLGNFLRTERTDRWPIRSQSYVLIDLPCTMYAAWDRLFTGSGPAWWLHAFSGTLAKGNVLNVHIGDASGTVDLTILEVGAPNYHTYPWISFAMKRPFWPCEVPGRIFLEPGAWPAAILQVYQTGWENLGPMLQQSERPIAVSFWTQAFRRAAQLARVATPPADATPWVLSAAERHSDERLIP
jgi:hypothetical protein